MENLYAAHDGNVYKRDDNGNWSKYDNGGWQPMNPPQSAKDSRQANQGNLDSQNKPSDRQALGDQPQSLGSSEASKPPAENQRQDRESRRTTGEGARQPSNDLTNSLNREASARSNGSRKVNLQQQTSRQDTTRSGRWNTERGSLGRRERGGR
jgi:hypothetical protein